MYQWPLSENQLNIYLDIKINDKRESYLIPLKFHIDSKVDKSKIVDALNITFDVHPILKSKVIYIENNPWMESTALPEIEYFNEDEKLKIEQYSKKSFDIEKSLCRFAIILNKDNSFSILGVFHHIIFDGMSVPVFKNHFSKILNGYSLEEDLTFLEVTEFDENIKTTNMYKLAEEFYEKEFDDNENITEPISDIGDNIPSYNSLTLNVDNNKISSFVRKHDITKNVLFTSVFAYMISRFTNTSNAYFTMIENGRDRFDSLNAIGMFVNTLPILIDCDNDSIGNFVKKSKEKIYQTIHYNFYPFRLLKNKYNVTANIDFQYQLNIEEEINASESESLFYKNLQNRKDLISDLSFTATDTTIAVTSSKKYSSSTTKRMLLIYERIFNEMIVKDNLSDINYSLKEDINVIDKINETETPFKYNDILEAFNNSLKKYPNNTLVSYLDTKFTYAQGAKWINNLTKQLKDIPKGSNIAILTHRSHFYLLTALAVLNHGCAYVPIDDTFPDSRIKFMLKNSEANVILCTSKTINRVKKLTKIPTINISDIKISGINKPLCANAKQNDNAIILYTSGTTGEPKGALIPRKSILNLAEWYAKETSLTNKDVYSMYVSYVFDMHTLGFYAPLIVGASLDIVPMDARLNLNKLNEHFNKVHATHTYITSQVGKLYAEGGYKTPIKLLCFGGMKLGELNAPDSIGAFESYGPTENLAISTSIFANKRIHHSSIGNFISNVKGYILDNELRPVPVGAIGELYLSGYQLSKGYLNREKENSEAFIPNPFTNESGYEVLYKTGDIVRLLPDNTLGIIGRIDSQVKIRGNRVELGEVETCIKQIKDVIDTTVQTIQVNGNNELVAYVATKNKNIKQIVTDYVAKHKPSYMVPTHVIALKKIPLNVNGKVDKKALPNVDTANNKAAYVAPSNDTEKIICDSFASVFKINQVSVNDDFNLLGGDSIKAIRLVSILNNKHLKVEANQILSLRTPKNISKVLSQKKAKVYKPVTGEVPLLQIQEYFFDQIKEKNTFNQCYVVKSNEQLDLEKLQIAFNKLTNLQDELRACFIKNKQIIRPLDTVVAKINEINTSKVIKEVISSEIDKSINSLNIKNNHLVDIKLINKTYLIFVIHHLIIDGVSRSILLDNLERLYHNIDIERPYPYSTFIKDTKKYSKHITQETINKYKAINDLVDEDEIKGYPFNIDYKFASSFDVNNHYELSENDFLLLAISRAYKKTYNRDIIYEMESHGRDEALGEVNQTIGWFTTIYPLIIKVSNSNNHLEIIHDLYKVKQASLDKKHLGIDYLIACYYLKKISFKHFPITFNFPSDEFSYSNSLFKTITLDNKLEDTNDKVNSSQFIFGLELNILKHNNVYFITGHCPANTYLSEKYSLFLSNIKKETSLISRVLKESTYIYPLYEEPLGVYLDEKVNNKGTAYSCFGYVKLDQNISNKNIKNSINKLINNHPVLKTRIIDIDGVTYGITDSKVDIKIINKDIKDISTDELIKPFNFDVSLTRFYIIRNKIETYIAYNIHHTISDATSNKLINDELIHGVTSQIDLGFIKKSNQWLKNQYSSEIESAKLFYEKEFSNIDDVEDPIADVNNVYGGNASIYIDDIKDDLVNLSNKLSITINSIFMSAFAYTLSRYTYRDNAYFAFTNHGRSLNGLDESLGMYVKTIPIVMNTEYGNVDDYLKESSKHILDAMKYSIYPFRYFINKYQLQQSVGFEYNNNLNNVSDFHNDTQYIQDKGKNVPHITDLLMVINDYRNGFICNIEHSAKYSKDTVIRFAKIYKKILEGLINNKYLKDIDYSLIEDIKGIDKINATETPLKYNNILEAFNNSLKKYPNNLMVNDGVDTFTYSEGAKWISGLVNKLTDYKENRIIAVFVKRSCYYLLCPLAILSYSATYVPIDDSLPDERIKFMLEDSGATALLVDSDTHSRAKGITNLKLINVDNIKKSNNSNMINSKIDPYDTSFIVYTSGTSGKPKAVEITNISIINLMLNFHKYSNYKLKSKFGVYSSFSFDAHNVMFVGCINGSMVSIIPDDVRKDVNLLNQFICENKITHTMLTTQFAKLFVGEIDKTTIQTIFVGGESLGDIPNKNNIKIIDAYGPTESLGYISCINYKEKIDSSSIGFINDNVKVYILDKEKRFVPFGAIGELYISGLQLAKGYLNRKKENKESFLQNFIDGNKQGYEKIYKTGDIVRYLPDGSLGFVGRADSQVKIRGNRVELAEVENAIRELKAVKDVTVQTTLNNGNKELVAYVVSVDKDIKAKIIEYVSSCKPNYMIPSYVIVLDKIPININGKVDKHALPNVDVSITNVYVAPTNDKEKIICEAFANIFNLDKVGIDDDFNLLGGDSVKAIRLVSILNDNRLTINANQILSLRTPKKICKVASCNDIKIYKPVAGEVKLLPIQKFFFDKIKEKNIFVQYYIVRATENIDIERLQNAFNKLTNIQDELRASFVNNKQFIQPINTVVASIKNINSTKDVKEIIKREVIKSVNSISLKDNHLIDINLINNQYITFVIHHLIIDGVSWSILLDNLSCLYMKENVKRPYPYAKYVKDINKYSKHITSSVIDKYNKINKLVIEDEIKGHPFSVNHKIKIDFNLNNPYDLSEKDFLLLSISRAYKKTYNRDIVYGMESYGRDDSIADVNKTIGWFTTIYPMLVKVSDKDSHFHIIKDLYEIKKATLDNSHLGIDYLIACYYLKKLKFTHMPVIFNFLSEEFSYSNKLFKNFVIENSESKNSSDSDIKREMFGISLNIEKKDGYYYFTGECASNTYIGNNYQEFMNNIDKEAVLILSALAKKEYIYPLYEEQLGVYLDEKVKDKGTVYSCSGYVQLDKNVSLNDAKKRINKLINAHPVLKTKIINIDGEIYGITNSKLDIKVINKNIKDIKPEEIIQPFNFEDSLSRFYIIQNKEHTYIAYDMHHMISDATSRILINNELTNGVSTNLDFGFINKSNQWLKDKFSSKIKDAKLFYEKEFSDNDKIVEPIEDINNNFGGNASFYLGDIKEKVLNVADKLEITPNSILASAFAYTISRFTYTDNAYFSFTNHGRDLEGLDSSFGMYVKTIPIVIDTSNQDVNSYLVNTSKHILDDMKHSIYPFRTLANKYHLSQNILFEYNTNLNELSGITDKIYYKKDTKKCQFHISDLLGVINDYENGFVFSVEHSSKYSKETVIRFIKTYKNILEGLLEKEKLCEIDYCIEEDVKVFKEVNQTEIKLKYNDILEAFNESVNKYPDNILVSYLDTKFSYKQGAMWISNLHKKLKAIPKGSNIAVIVHRSHYCLLAALGVLAYGCAYVPIDDSYPDERVKFMLEDSKAKIVLATSKIADRIKNITKLPVVDISSIESNATVRSFSPCLKQDETAVVLYTSGTTGEPKGSLISRKAIMNLAQWYVKETKLKAKDVYSMYVSYVFDMHTLGFYAPLLVGASLDIVPEDIRLSLNKVNEHFNKVQATHTYMTAQVGKLYAESGYETSIKLLCFGGMKLGELNAPDSIGPFESYGPTENLAITTSIYANKRIHHSSIGTFIDNVNGYILDREHRLVPKGAIGELYVSGFQLSKGYINRDKENVEAFIDNPFTRKQGHEVLYKTGDIVRLLPDNTLGIIGRADSQVKIRGNRVELDEVETCIKQVKGIEDVTVQAVQLNGNSELVAYVVTKNKKIKDLLIQHVRDNKPVYMIPSHVVVLDKIPLNINGKVDKRVLPKVDNVKNIVEYVAPTNEIEKTICDAYAKIFNLEKVGINDSFIDLGGDSLKSIKLLSLLKDFDVSVVNILDNDTPKNLSKFIKGKNNSLTSTMITGSYRSKYRKD